MSRVKLRAVWLRVEIYDFGVWLKQILNRLKITFRMLKGFFKPFRMTKALLVSPKGHPELVSGSLHFKVYTGFGDLILCFILIIEEMLKLRTRIKRAFTSLRTLLVLFSMTIRKIVAFQKDVVFFHLLFVSQ